MVDKSGKFSYFAELTPSISSLTTYIWSDKADITEWIKDVSVAYKSEDGVLFVKLVSK